MLAGDFSFSITKYYPFNDFSEIQDFKKLDYHDPWRYPGTMPPYEFQDYHKQNGRVGNIRIAKDIRGHDSCLQLEDTHPTFTCMTGVNRVFILNPKGFISFDMNIADSTLAPQITIMNSEEYQTGIVFTYRSNQMICAEGNYFVAQFEYNRWYNYQIWWENNHYWFIVSDSGKVVGEWDKDTPLTSLGDSSAYDILRFETGPYGYVGSLYIDNIKFSSELFPVQTTGTEETIDPEQPITTVDNSTWMIIIAGVIILGVIIILIKKKS